MPLTSGGSKALAEELTALIALADNLWNQASAKWDAVAVRLTSVAEGSELWTQAVNAVRGGVQSLTAKEDAGPVVLVIMPPRGGRHYKRGLENAAEKRAAVVRKKKDVSAQFIILTITSLLLFFGAIASVALLFNLGGEELPSSLTLAPK